MIRRAAVLGLARIAVVASVCAIASGCGGAAAPDAPLSVVDTGALSDADIVLGGPVRLGERIRFVDRGDFAVQLLLSNTSDRALTVLGARTHDPARSLAQHVGTRLALWHQRPCALYNACPRRTVQYGEVTPTARTVAPGAQVLVHLNYRLASCQAAPSRTTSSASAVDVTYRYGGAPAQHQLIPLGNARLQLERPSPSACLSPHSRIVVTGRDATSSEQAVPGAYGDTCVHTHGGLVFWAPTLAAHRRTVAVTVILPRFTGAGVYRLGAAHGNSTHTAAAFVSSTAQRRRSTLPYGRSFSEQYSPESTTVTVDEATGSILAGSLDATLTGYKTKFQVHGTWRCTTLLNDDESERLTRFLDRSELPLP